MKKIALYTLILAASTFAQFPGPPASYPRIASDTISDTALVLWQIPSYGGSNTAKIRSMTWEELATGVANTVDSLAGGCTNSGFTGTGPCVRSTDATLIRPTTKWLNQTGKSTAGNQIVGVGDSNMEGIPNTAITWLNMLNTQIPFPVRPNLGIGGQTAGKLDSNGAYVDSLFNPLVQNILINNIGTNNAPQGTSALTTYNQIVSYNRARQAKGWKVISMTIPDRCGYNSWRDSLNIYIRQNWPTFSSALADLAASPLIGAQGTCTDTTYFDGGLHFKVAGKKVIRDIAQNAINTLYPNPLTINPVYYGTGYAKMSNDTIIGDSTAWTAAMVGMIVQWPDNTVSEIAKYISGTRLTAKAINPAVSSFVPYVISRAGVNQIGGNLGIGTVSPSSPVQMVGLYNDVDAAIGLRMSNYSQSGTSNAVGVGFSTRSGFSDYTDRIRIYGTADGQTTLGDNNGQYLLYVNAGNARGLVIRQKISSTGATEFTAPTFATGDPAFFNRTPSISIRNWVANFGEVNALLVQDSSADSTNGVHHVNFKVWDAATVVGGNLNVMTMHHNGDVTIGRNGADMGSALGVRGTVDATAYKVGGAAGVSGTCSAVTVVNGIVTGCTP